MIKTVSGSQPLDIRQARSYIGKTVRVVTTGEMCEPADRGLDKTVTVANVSTKEPCKYHGNWHFLYWIYPTEGNRIPVFGNKRSTVTILG